jgi:hypothetical protein
MQLQPPYMPQNPMLPPPVSSRLVEPPPAPAQKQVQSKDLTGGRKFQVATFLTLLFIALSNPYVQAGVNKLFTFVTTKDPLITELGTLTMMGVFVHALLFFIIALLLLFK